MIDDRLDALIAARKQLIRSLCQKVAGDLSLHFRTFMNPNTGRVEKSRIREKMHLLNTSHHERLEILEAVDDLADRMVDLHTAILAQIPCLGHPNSTFSLLQLSNMTVTRIDGFRYQDLGDEMTSFRSRITFARDRLCGIDAPRSRTAYAVGNAMPIVADDRATAIVIHAALDASEEVRATSLTCEKDS